MTFMGSINQLMAQQFQSENGDITAAGSLTIHRSSSITINSGAVTQSPNSIVIPLPPSAFLSELKNYSPLLAEQASHAFETKDADEQTKILFEIRELLKPDFANWNQMEKSQKQSLEQSYCYLWACLLQLQRRKSIDKKTLEEYKSELTEDGPHVPSLLVAFNYGPRYQELHEEFVALLRKTKNAATICNCCYIMATTYESVSDPKHREYIERLLQKKLDWQLELYENPNCWELFEEKRKALQSESLTEHMAMGIILLQEVFYSKVEEEEIKKESKRLLAEGITRKPPGTRFLPRRTYLFEMEEVMQGRRALRSMTRYADEIKKMLEAQ